MGIRIPGSAPLSDETQKRAGSHPDRDREIRAAVGCEGKARQNSQPITDKLKLCILRLLLVLRIHRAILLVRLGGRVYVNGSVLWSPPRALQETSPIVLNLGAQNHPDL